MPTIRLIGHQYAYPAADVLRLFYGPLSCSGQDVLQAGPDEPVIESRLTVAGPKHVRIQTTLAGSHIEAHVPESLARREIKRQIYQVLSSWTGCAFPWGSLTGIRPTQVAAESLAGTSTVAEARREMIEHWFVSPEKADLALETAAAERILLGGIPAGSSLVYIGVPFCPSRCAYCSFITQDAASRVKLLEPYVEAVIREASGLFRQQPHPSPVAGVYIGGGTPTSLPDVLLERLLQGALSLLPVQRGFELTVEAGRPDTITPANLAIIRAAGATRLCINPQTFHDATLKRIGRCHDTAQTRLAYHLARSLGFAKINMDLIAGLPGEAPEDFADSLNQALLLEPDSITVHTLALKRSARLKQQTNTNDGISLGRPDPALAAMLSTSRRLLKSAGYFPYYLYRQKDTAGGLENTGFAKSGAGCLYNVGMMSDRCPVVGLGSGAMTKMVWGSRVERLANPRDIANYIDRLDEIVEKKRAFMQPGSCQDQAITGLPVTGFSG
jgi:coproporphyrinogen dehydrogenase HemZ